MVFGLKRKPVAEMSGTGSLIATVVGSGIMAGRLVGDVAFRFLGMALPTGAVLAGLFTGWPIYSVGPDQKN